MAWPQGLNGVIGHSAQIQSIHSFVQKYIFCMYIYDGYIICTVFCNFCNKLINQFLVDIMIFFVAWTTCPHNFTLTPGYWPCIHPTWWLVSFDKNVMRTILAIFSCVWSLTSRFKRQIRYFSANSSISFKHYVKFCWVCGSFSALYEGRSKFFVATSGYVWTYVPLSATWLVVYKCDVV